MIADVELEGLGKIEVMSTTKANLAQRVKYFEAVMARSSN